MTILHGRWRRAGPPGRGRPDLKSDGAATYQYDLENRLRGQGSATLAYDPLGRLFETQTGGTPNVVTRYVYDGPNLIAEYSGAGAFQRRYVHGPGADEPLVQYMDSGATPEYLLADHQGSIIAATAANGAIATATVGSTTVRKVLTRKTMSDLLDHPRALPGDAIEKAAISAAMAPLLTPAQVADMLTVSERTLERWRMTGEGPEYIAISRKVVRYDDRSITNFLEKRRRQNTAFHR